MGTLQSLPPQFTAAGGQSLADTDVVVPITILENHSFSMTVAASDPEGDALTYNAFMLQLGMAFDPATRTFSWTPPLGTAGNTYYAKFIVTTPSGGTDSFIAKIAVTTTGPPGSPAGPAAAGTVDAGSEAVSFSTPFARGAIAQLEVFDVNGRRVGKVEAPSGQRITWNRRDATGRSIPSGVYAYRLVVGGWSRSGKLLVMR